MHGGGGCQYCNGGRLFTTEEIKQKILAVNNKVDVSYVKYTGIFNKIKLKCKVCNKFWDAIPNNILHNFHGCPHCNESRGERKISKFLKDNGIKFTPQKKFKELKHKKQLRCDFYIKKYNLIIEYNGEQHYDRDAFGKTFEEFLIQKHRDWLKRDYAKKHGINFLVIPYWEFDNIEKILTEVLKLS